MYVKFLKDHGDHKGDEVVLVSAGYAELLLGGGFAKEAERPQPKEAPKPRKK